ncbi:MAG: peptidylprolyl isomerase [Marinicella sp.]|nr:peptidylprolyl isomerase [Xanthomonadales bacterium]
MITTSKKKYLFVLILFLVACTKQAVIRPNTEAVQVRLTPGQVISQANNNEWRSLDPENTLYLTLNGGLVVIELMPLLAPGHVENTKALIRQGVFDGTSFYRVLDGFVAQGGPLYESVEQQPPLASGQYNIPSEFTYTGDISAVYTAFDAKDNFADETGFVDGFAVGKDLNSGENWLLHCYGVLAMGRSNDLNSGGVALYIVNGPAQRYLDRNTTVFGRVIAGMEYVQALKRSANIDGPVDVTGMNIIHNIKVAADVPAEDVLPLQVMDSRSASFKKLLEARKNRTGDWFIYQHNYMDACGVPIPVRLYSGK